MSCHVATRLQCFRLCRGPKTNRGFRPLLADQIYLGLEAVESLWTTASWLDWTRPMLWHSMALRLVIKAFRPMNYPLDVMAGGGGERRRIDS